jgi:hypothetical protein
MDLEGVLTWIDDYCKTHPAEQLHNATEAFVVAHPR